MYLHKIVDKVAGWSKFNNQGCIGIWRFSSKILYGLCNETATSAAGLKVFNIDAMEKNGTLSATLLKSV